MSEWVEIRVPLTLAPDEPWDPDDIAGLLAAELEAAKAGTWLMEDCIVYWVPAERGEAELARARAAVAELYTRDVPLSPEGTHARPAEPEASWRDAWKRHFRTTRITRQLVVVPSWDQPEGREGDLDIHLDPEQAFGTGAHASTQLVLERMQQIADRGERPTSILDVGAGSGILAIAGALLWPELYAIAIDNDPEAVAVAAENCRKNGVADHVTCAATPADEIEGTFDLVAANIQADVLRELAEPLAARIAPGGHLLLSGLLAHQAEGVAEVFESTRRVAREALPTSDRDPEWRAVHLRAYADLP